MRVAIFSDIHGNIIGLDAVLKDIANSGSFDEYWILGDLVALGPCPVEVLERISTLPNTRIIPQSSPSTLGSKDRRK